MGHGGRAPGRAGTSRISRLGMCACWGRDSTGEATGLAAADRVRNALREATCPAKGTVKKIGTKRGRPASQAAPGGDDVHEVWLGLHHLTEDPMRQAFPASAGGPFPRGSPRRHPWGVAFLEGWELGRAWCRGTSTLQALGLSVSLPFRRAASTILVPCLCGSQPPREGGLHERWSDCTHSCHGEAASLITGCAVDPTIPCDLLYLSVRIAETLAIGNDC